MVFLPFRSLTMARGKGSRRRRGGLVEIGPRVGTASPKASCDSKQGGESGRRSSIQYLPGPALATSGQEVQAVPGGPSEGVGSLIGQTTQGGLESAQGGRRMRCQFLEGLTDEKPLSLTTWRKGSPFPCVIRARRFHRSGSSPASLAFCGHH